MGAVVVREGCMIAGAFNQVEIIKDATAHAEKLAFSQAKGLWAIGGLWLHSFPRRTLPDVRRSTVHVHYARSVAPAIRKRALLGRIASLQFHAQPPLRDHRRRS